MSDKGCQYVAFISYRHNPGDIKIARETQAFLEHYRIPPAFRHNGKHLGKVFRDQDELPLSLDLSEDIRKALDHSEYFIAICSPDYSLSRWCMSELDYFLLHHNREKILTILAAGIPSRSFPPQVLEVRDETGNLIREVEPLAADLTNKTGFRKRGSRRQEYLRIAAAVLGVSYDGLVNRERRYQARRLAGIVSAIILTLILFIAMLVDRNQKLNHQYALTQQYLEDTVQNFGKLTAKQAHMLTDAGDRYGALREMIDYWAEYPDIYLPELQESLSYSLYSYFDTGYYPVCTVNLDSAVLDFLTLPEQDFFIVAAEEKISAYGVDGRSLWEFSQDGIRYSDYEYGLTGDGFWLVLAGNGSWKVLNAKTGVVEFEYEPNEIADDAFVYPLLLLDGDNRKVVMAGDSRLYVYNAMSGELEAEIPVASDGGRVYCRTVALSADGKYMAALLDDWYRDCCYVLAGETAGNGWECIYEYEKTPGSLFTACDLFRAGDRSFFAVFLEEESPDTEKDGDILRARGLYIEPGERGRQYEADLSFGKLDPAFCLSPMLSGCADGKYACLTYGNLVNILDLSDGELCFQAQLSDPVISVCHVGMDEIEGTSPIGEDGSFWLRIENGGIFYIQEDGSYNSYRIHEFYPYGCGDGNRSDAFLYGKDWIFLEAPYLNFNKFIISRKFENPDAHPWSGKEFDEDTHLIESAQKDVTKVSDFEVMVGEEHLTFRVPLSQMADYGTCCGSRLFYAVYRNNEVELYKLGVPDETKVLHLSLGKGTGRKEYITVESSEDGKHVYVYAAGSQMYDGYCIDWDTMEICMEIPHMAAYLPATDEIVKYDYGKEGKEWVYPVYSYSDLLNKAKKLLE